MSTSPANQIAGSVPDVRAGRADLRGIVRDVIDGAVKDDVMGLASELTHHMALTVFPSMLMVTALPSIAGALFDIPDPSERISQERSSLVSCDNGELGKSRIRERRGT